MMHEELALTADLRAPRWHKDDVNPDKPFKVVDRRRRDVGHHRRLPPAAGRRPVRGAREERRRRRHVAREQLSRLSRRHPEPLLQLLVRPARRLAALLQPAVRAATSYFRECVDEFGIRPNIRFGTEVSSIVVRRRRRRCGRVSTVGPARRRGQHRGQRGDQRGRAAQPPAAARASRAATASPARRSTRRAGSTTSISPASASRSSAPAAARRSSRRSSPSRSAHVEVFQRTPNWHVPRAALPRGGARRASSGCSATCPTTASGTGSGCSGEAPSSCARWPRSTRAGRDQSRSVSELNDMLRELLTEAIVAQYPDRPDLLEKVAAAVPAGGEADHRRQRRVGRRRCTATTSTLTTTPIDRIVPEGVVTVDGQLHEFDVMIFGTGFQPSRFLTPMKVVGRGGVDLHDRWDGDARAYLGVTVPGLPELLPAVRTEHEHRRQRQHHLVLRVRSSLRDGLHSQRPRRRPPARRREARGARPVQRGDRRREPADGVGRVDGELVVQERQRPRGPELAVPAARVLATHPRGRTWPTTS